MTELQQLRAWRKAFVEQRRKAGRVTSPAKARAARENGKKHTAKK